MKWQSIESAPKDGTVVDVWNDGERVIDAWFNVYDGRWLTSDGEWTSALEPTHWMPIAEPPEGETDTKDRNRFARHRQSWGALAMLVRDTDRSAKRRNNED